MMNDGSMIPAPSRVTEIARLELARLSATAPLEQAFRLACELAADALKIERVSVWLFVDHRSALRCVNLYERSKNEHSSGAVLRVDDCPRYFASLKLRKAAPAEMAITDAWTAELAELYLAPLGIASMLDAGIFVDGELVGVVCHEHVGQPIEWTTEARDFAASVADLLALRIQSAEMHDVRANFLTDQDRLFAREKIAALEQFAAGVAHDLRNLLSVFLSHGELLSERTDLPPEARTLAEQIVTHAKRGAALTQELIDFARPSPGPLSVFDVATLTNELVPQLRSQLGAKHQLNVRCEERAGFSLLHRTQFARVLHNLVANARDSMPRGGVIDLEIAPVTLRDTARAKSYVQIDVRDHGAGIDETTQARIFDPFFTTKPAGTGLGLSIVRQLIERVGGFTRVESRVGQGTTIRLFLPRIGAGGAATTGQQVA